MRPRAYLVARPAFDYEAFDSFLKDEGTVWRRSPDATEAEELVEAAGRICYMSFGEAQSPRTNAEYLSNLIHLGHESVLEHATWGFVLAGVSRSFSHQLVRHRVGIAISQLSQQYHDESSATFISPPGLELSEQAVKAWHRAVELARSSYTAVFAAWQRARGLRRRRERWCRRIVLGMPHSRWRLTSFWLSRRECRAPYARRILGLRSFRG